MHALQRPYWKRKRWIAAAVLWLVVAYPVSLGPACYAVGRGWLSEPIMSLIYAPIFHDWTEDYGKWAYHLGQEHAASL